MILGSPVVDRYAKSIEKCDAPERLFELLKVIISAGLTEQEFSFLYAAATARRKSLVND